MMDSNVLARLKRVATRQTLTLTHYGRKTGKPHAVTIWFVLDHESSAIRERPVCGFTRSPIADLAISMTEAPNPVPHGTNLTYTLTVNNKGPDAATSTVVSDAIPVGTTFVGFSTTLGTCTAPAVGGTGTLSCKVGSLVKGAKVTVTMTVKATAVAGSTLTDTAKASSATPDPNTWIESGDGVANFAMAPQ